LGTIGTAIALGPRSARIRKNRTVPRTSTRARKPTSITPFGILNEFRTAAVKGFTHWLLGMVSGGAVSNMAWICSCKADVKSSVSEPIRASYTAFPFTNKPM